MPISEKIMKQVDDAKVTPDERLLMKDILQIEDKGLFRYNADYEKVIKDFIAAHEDEALK
jgi:hypothetical protein